MYQKNGFPRLLPARQRKLVHLGLGLALGVRLGLGVFGRSENLGSALGIKTNCSGIVYVYALGMPPELVLDVSQPY